MCIRDRYEGELFNLEATPAESTAYRLAKHDRKPVSYTHLDAHGTGVDLSDEALKVAVQNARTLGVAEHTEFVQSNLFSEMQNIVYGTEYMKRTAVKMCIRDRTCSGQSHVGNIPAYFSMSHASVLS